MGWHTGSTPARLAAAHPARHNDKLNCVHKKTAESGHVPLNTEMPIPYTGFCQCTARLALGVIFVKCENHFKKFNLHSMQYG